MVIVPKVPVDSVIDPLSATKYAVAPVVLVGIETSPISPGKVLAPSSDTTDFALKTSTNSAGKWSVPTKFPPAEAVPFT